MTIARVVTTAALALAVTAVAPVPALAAPDAATGADSLSALAPTWRLTATNSTARLRGLSAISRDVAWASGSVGTVLRTTNGGQSWAQVGPPDTAALQFRDIEAFSAREALALSIGTGTDSRIYRTTDGGARWTEVFRNDEPTAFYDCMAFFDSRHGLALSDPVDGKFRVLSTSDGGRSWQVLPSDGMPAALEGEFAFAASGQCITTAGGRDAWIATGGSTSARVLHSSDRGRTWTASDTPLTVGPSAGVFSVAFRDPHTGVAIGGDFDPANTADSLVATTRDGGSTWREPYSAPASYRSGLTWHPHLPTVLIAVGPTGSDLSLTGGLTWHQFDSGSFDTVDCAHDGACWASGAQGRVAVLGYHR